MAKPVNQQKPLYTPHGCIFQYDRYSCGETAIFNALKLKYKRNIPILKIKGYCKPRRKGMSSKELQRGLTRAGAKYLTMIPSTPTDILKAIRTFKVGILQWVWPHKKSGHYAVIVYYKSQYLLVNYNKKQLFKLAGPKTLEYCIRTKKWGAPKLYILY